MMWRHSGWMLVALFCISFVTDTRGQTRNVGEYGQGLILDSDEILAKIAKTPVYRANIPERMDLSRYFPSPGNQGMQGSCVGWAVGYAARAYYAVATEGNRRNNYNSIPSPAYIYNTIKGDGDCQTGSRISDALDLLQNSGSASFQNFPYDQSSCRRPDPS